MPRQTTTTDDQSAQEEMRVDGSGTGHSDAPLGPSPVNLLDPFHPDNLRLPQSFAEAAGVKKLLTTIPVRKPSRQDFVRVNPDPDYRLSPAGLIEMKEDGEVYLVAPSLLPDLPGEFVGASLYLGINRQNVLFVWPVRLPGVDGRILEWHRSAAEAAEHAMTKWVRVAANKALGAYELFEASGNIPDPVWPSQPFNELLKIAFKNYLISDLDHAVLRRLRGEA
jgi:hypothetical protein